MKPGDFIVCVDNSTVEDALTLNETYLVVEVNLHYIRVVSNQGKTGGFYPHRFKSIDFSLHGADEYEEIMAIQEAMNNA